MLLVQLFGGLVKSGQLRLIDARGKSHYFGSPAAQPITLRLHDAALPYKLLLNAPLAFGEAYMDGRITIEQGTLPDLIDLYVKNTAHRGSPPLGALATWMGLAFRRLQQYNPVGRARANVAHHYDLSGALYDLFLDRDRQYSCAYFRSPEDSLETAQENKKRHIAAKLLLKPGQKVLDIGCGWGGLALYLASISGVDVTGITLSEEQMKVATQRRDNTDLSDHVHFHLRDYRHEQGRYDRIVSVGMFEHVGIGHYDEYFRKIRDLLTDDGVALVHSIGRTAPPGGTNAWLRKYIFPGGYSPALSEVLKTVERTGLWVTDIEVLRLHYAHTLHEWYTRFMANRDQVRALYDERFCRMWEFYLVSCEAAFRHWDQMVFQIQLTKRRDAVPLTRDYMFEWENARLHKAEAAE